jgi:hypothetical protein
MDSKWPFFIITFGLLFLLGITISKLEKTGVIKNWDKRRCQFPVMMAANFFKPSDDKRSGAEFASDNFQFCMKSYVNDFLDMALAPFQAIFGQQANIAGTSLGMLNSLRNTTATMYNAFLSVLQPYFQKFNYATYEINRIVHQLRFAFRRLNAITIGSLYTSLTMFRGMLNTIQFIIKVILIICGILLAILIILIFVLFPVIPLIVSVLGAIIGTVLVISMYVGGTVDSAVSMKNGFCFDEDTKINIQTLDGSKCVSVKEVQIGDNLTHDCGKVTAIIKMVAENVDMYELNGIIVSGSHVVLGDDGIWKLVEEDKRAKSIQNTSKILYCFNTTTRKIPIVSYPIGSIQIFRDWEELSDDDNKGQYMWNYFILKYLNQSTSYNKWKTSLKVSNDIPLLGKNILVKTGNNKWKKISDLGLLDHVIDKHGNYQRVLAIIDGEINDVSRDIDIDDDKWYSELLEWDAVNDVWIKGTSILRHGTHTIYGKTIIVETGEFIIKNSDGDEKMIRDFTDIGCNEIHQSYSLVAERLRLEQEIIDNLKSNK